MSDPFDLAHSLAKSLAPFNHLVVAATDQAYLIGRLQGEVKEILFDLDEAIKQRDEARRMYCKMVENNARQYGTSAESVATQAGWDCFKDEPRWNSDPNIISLDELTRCTRNQTP